MRASKIITLLSALEASEMRWLQKFINSPFYNSNQNCSVLFDYLRKYYPAFDHPKLTKEIIHQKLFPTQKYNAQRVNKLVHQLTTIVEEFMVVRHLQKHPKKQRKLLTEAYGQRNLYELFEKNINKILAENDAEMVVDEHTYLEKYTIRQLYFSHPMTLKDAAITNEVLQNGAQLDRYFLLEKLYLACMVESAKFIYKIPTKLPLMDEVITEIEKQNLSRLPVFELYLMIYRLFRQSEENRALFNSIKEKYDINRALLSRYNQMISLKYLINYSLSYVNAGKKSYVKDTFDLYKIGIQHQLLIENGQIGTMTFLNIIVNASALNKVTWAKAFVMDYQKFLSESTRNDVVNFGLARIAFSARDFQAVTNYLKPVKTESRFYNFVGRILLIKSYFQLLLQDDSYYEFVLTNISTLERAFHREKNISSERIQAYLKFASYLRQLVKCYWQKKSVESILSAIKEEEYLSNKPWLIEVGEEIMNLKRRMM